MIDAHKVTGGNPEAIYFLKAWGEYLRHVDDAVDNPDYSEERLTACFALGNTVYSSLFYRRNSHHLQMAILTGASLWSLANEWERSPEIWKQQHADILRNTDILMLNAVAQLCTGWQVAKDASRALLAAGFATHRLKYGLPGEEKKSLATKIADSWYGPPSQTE